MVGRVVPNYCRKPRILYIRKDNDEIKRQSDRRDSIVDGGLICEFVLK